MEAVPYCRTSTNLSGLSHTKVNLPKFSLPNISITIIIKTNVIFQRIRITYPTQRIQFENQHISGIVPVGKVEKKELTKFQSIKQLAGHRRWEQEGGCAPSLWRWKVLSSVYWCFPSIFILFPCNFIFK